eukprot:tig00000378_g24507.t1
MATKKTMILYSKASPPVVLAIAANLSGASVQFAPSPVSCAEVRLPSGDVLRGDLATARYFARAFPSARLYGSSADPVLASEVDMWIELVDREIVGAEDALARIDSHLTLKAFVVGHSLTLADLAVFAAIRGHAGLEAAKASGKAPHLARWLAYIEGLPATKAGLQAVGAGKGAAPSPAPAGGKEAAAADAKKTGQSTGSFEIDLPGAAEGNVVTRFPPEPSGYLHIGHAKAALLNDYFARRYKGKLILRFDDTNPSKEKDEFVENIIADLATLQIKPDVTTHTSDYFDKCAELCERMIKEGKAYVDDTPVEKLRDERMKGIEAAARSAPVEESLKLWKEMLAGSERGQQCCVRAKIDMQAKNKALRDPIMYRCNLTPHHRTGAKWKCYPTYDFACPIVDSVEGVTHAMRTSEYHDRNDQYYWFIDAMGLRKPHIWDYSRMNFVYTLLSKRKLQWFVDKGRVAGWDDPRFPTVQGIMRRGLLVEALREFILSQGASKALNLMEWDKLWTINKKMIDPIAPRYTALGKGAVPFALAGGPERPEARALPRHKKNADLGTKTVEFYREVLLDPEDAGAVKEGEEVTLMDWGNAFVDKIERDAAGKVVRLSGRLHLEGDFKKTEKKLTWLANTPAGDLVPVKLQDFDFLITKKKIEEEDNFEDFLNPKSVAESEAVGMPDLRNVQKGEIIQLERKGFFICDSVFVRDSRPIVLIAIPDGRAKPAPGGAAAPAPAAAAKAAAPAKPAAKK